MLRGVNVDPLNQPPSPDELLAHHFNAVRIVMRPDGNLCEDYGAACLKLGLFVLGVETKASGGYMMASVSAYQLGNEPDGNGPSSDIQTPDEFVAMFNLYTDQYHASTGKPFIAAGLCSGNNSVAFWTKVAPQLRNCAGLALHPYGLQLAAVKTLVDAIEAVTPGMPVWITEWHRPAIEIPGYDWWLRKNLAGAFWFCWGDWMVPGFGLYQTDGIAKPELAEFRSFDDLSSNTQFPSPLTPPPAPILVPPPLPPLVRRISPNFWKGRPNGPPIAIVIHTMDGTLAATDAWFANPTSQVSAHYGVGLDGACHQYVLYTDSAWGNGILEPGNTWPGPPGINPNYLTLSIETEDLGNASQPVTDAQYASVLGLCRNLVGLYPSVKWLLRHENISPHSRPNCPGNRWVASGRFAALAAALSLKMLA